MAFLRISFSLSVRQFSFHAWIVRLKNYFKVIAQETLTPERYESNVTVIINITDVNDHNPSCSKEIYKVIVDENQPNGTHVAQVWFPLIFLVKPGQFISIKWGFLKFHRSLCNRNYDFHDNVSLKNLIYF